MSIKKIHDATMNRIPHVQTFLKKFSTSYFKCSCISSIWKKVLFITSWLWMV